MDRREKMAALVVLDDGHRALDHLAGVAAAVDLAQADPLAQLRVLGDLDEVDAARGTGPQAHACRPGRSSYDEDDELGSSSASIAGSPLVTRRRRQNTAVFDHRKNDIRSIGSAAREGDAKSNRKRASRDEIRDSSEEKRGAGGGRGSRGGGFSRDEANGRKTAPGERHAARGRAPRARRSRINVRVVFLRQLSKRSSAHPGMLA